MNSSAKMDKFIRLSSMQSGAFNGINNMITFNLPQDGAYDFSSSYAPKKVLLFTTHSLNGMILQLA
mgnify:CR=1 FL=1